MSFLIFRQSDDVFYGAMVFDSPEEWQIEFSKTPFLEGRCRSDEGDGSWFIVDPDSNQWATILRRDDSPYNDCLPPSETLLAEGFRSRESLEDRLQYIASTAGSGFYNPFNVIIGAIDTGTTKLLKQSFQSQTRTIDRGVHVIRDYHDLDDTADFLREEIETVPEKNELESIFVDRNSPDGLRKPAAMIEVTYSDAGWRFNDFMKKRTGSQWRDRGDTNGA